MMRLYRGLFAITLACGALLLGACDAPGDVPDVVAGPTTGATGISYEFTAVAPGDEPLQIQFNWGDGDTSAWSGSVAGGDSVTLAHAWDSTGAYDVKARARNDAGDLTEWSDAHRITIIETWIDTIGSAGDEYPFCIKPTADGGFIAVGYTTAGGAGGCDVWLAKLEADGDTAWTRTYGGASDEYGYGVVQAGDGGFVLCGTTYSYGAGEGDIWLVKTNASGAVAWSRFYGGTGDEQGFGFAQAADGGYIVAGQTSSYGAGGNDVWLVKLEADGDTAWTRTYGGTANDDAVSVRQTADGGYIVGGSTRSRGAGDSDYWMLKTDADGDTAWTRTYGGASYDRGQSVGLTADGGYILCGASSSYGAGGRDAWLVRTDADGDTTWTGAYGTAAVEWACFARQTADGGFVFTGWTNSQGAGSHDVWLVRTDADGDTTWTRTFGGAELDYGYWVEQAGDGGFIVAGETQSFGAGGSDVYIIKTDAAGDIGH